MVTIWLIAGFTLGYIFTSKIFLRKELAELEYHRKKELELFDSTSICLADKNDSSSNEVEIVNTEKFSKIPLSISSQGLNAIYENDFFIFSFHLEAESFSEFLHVSAEVRDRYMQIIKTKIESGAIVKIPENVLDINRFGSILQTGKVTIYSKEDKKNIEYILAGHNINRSSKTASAIEVYFCLPNGTVISKKHEGMICGIRRPA